MSLYFHFWDNNHLSLDGIGAEYVKQLAKSGLNIIVVGRNPEKLKSIQQCVVEVGQKCETVRADLSNQKEIQQASEQLEKICKEKTVGVLVNNAGISYRKVSEVKSLTTILSARPSYSLKNIG